MKRSQLVATLLLFFSNPCLGEIRIAFFSTLAADGKIVQLEPGGRFSHVAIAYKDGWVHADPKVGVVFAYDLEEIGHVSSILSSLSHPALTEAQVLPYLGKPYDRAFNWKDPDTAYCSKLVGNLLGIHPMPMKFHAKGWTGFKSLPKGEVGLSPDDIYQVLLKRNFRESYTNCSDLLRMIAVPKPSAR